MRDRGCPTFGSNNCRFLTKFWARANCAVKPSVYEPLYVPTNPSAGIRLESIRMYRPRRSASLVTLDTAYTERKCDIVEERNNETDVFAYLRRKANEKNIKWRLRHGAAPTARTYCAYRVGRRPLSEGEF